MTHPTLHVLDDGPSNGTPVLMLHSLFFDGSMFDDVITRLRAEPGGDRRYLRPDHLGQASSGGHGDADLSIVRLAETYVQWLRANVDAPVHLVGSSMGGYVALRMLLDHPEIVASCALLGATAHAEGEPERFDALADALATQGPAALVDTLAWTMFGDDFLAADAAALAYWKRAFASRPADVSAAVRGVAARPSVLDRLDEIDVPLLLIAGGQDHAKPAWHMHDIAARVPGSHLVEINDSGHTPAVERPDVVARELHTWLTDHEAARTYSALPNTAALQHNPASTRKEHQTR